MSVCPGVWLLHCPAILLPQYRHLAEPVLRTAYSYQQIAGHCQVFITVDRNMRYQQNLSACPFGVIVLVAASNDIADLTPLMPEVLIAIPLIQPGEVREIGERSQPKKTVPDED